MTRPMRITYLLDTFRSGGKERRCLQLIQGLNKAGYNDIQVIIIDNEVAYQELYQTNAQIQIIDRKGKHLSQWAVTKIVKKHIKDFHPDIIQAWGWMSASCGLILKPIIRTHFLVAYVANVQRPTGIYGLINKSSCLIAEKIIGNSAIGLKVYGIPKKKAVLIYNGFNEERLANPINTAAKKRDLGISTPFVVAMVASFLNSKDWDCYLNAAKIIIAKRKDVCFLAVGDGEDRIKYEQQLTQEYAPYIRFLGRRADVDELFQICDLTVLTSKHGEGISNSIMESMAFGVPAIASDAGGTPEIITNNVNGLLLKNNDATELSKEIERLINDASLRRRLSENAQKTIQEHFSLSRMTQEYINLYTCLLN